MVNRYQEAYQRLNTSWETLRSQPETNSFVQLLAEVQRVGTECEREYQQLGPEGEEVYNKLLTLYDTLKYNQYPYRWIRDRRCVEPQELNLRQVESTEKYPALVEKGYKKIQYVRGDGNCFYRAVYMHLVDRCLRHPVLAQQFKATLDGMSDQDSNGVMDALQHLNANNSLSFNSLCATNQNFDLAMVRIMRKIAANYIRSHKELHDFMTEDVESFCREVLTLGKDGRETVIPALADALGIKVTVASMDSHGNITFNTFGHGEEVAVFLHGEYRDQEGSLVGGHYDILIKD